MCTRGTAGTRSHQGPDRVTSEDSDLKAIHGDKSGDAPTILGWRKFSSELK